MARRKEDQAFLRLVQDRDLLAAEQVDELTGQQRVEARNGVSKSLAQLALEHHFLSEDTLGDIETEIWVESMPTRIGDYDLGRLIGRGGMSVVFMGSDVSLGKVVALKVLLPQFTASTAYLARFHREARLAARLSHPNTVQVFRTGCDNGLHFLVMEYVEGRPVSTILRERRCLRQVDALEIAADVASSLDEAHQLGIIHRDVKPANMLVSKWGIVKLADFGIAKQIVDIGDEALQRSLTMGVVGTPYYMSPEQARGARDIDHRTDIYSLGASLYHMLVGSPPHEARTPQETLCEVATKSAPDPRIYRPELSEVVAEIVVRMLAQRPEDRYPDCTELQAALQKALAQLDPERESAARTKAGRGRLAGLYTPTSHDAETPTPGDRGADFPASQARWERARLSRVLFTAGVVVFLGAALLLFGPKLRGCRAEKARDATSPQPTVSTGR